MGRNAPKLWPALPVKRIRIVLSGRPSSPWRSETAEPSMVPTVRFTLRIGSDSSTGSMFSIAGRQSRISSSVERLLEPVLLAAHAPASRRPRRAASARCRIAAPVEAAGQLPVADRRVALDEVGPADHVVELAEAERGQDLARLLGDEAQEAHDVLGLAGELLAQLLVLGGDADRAGVQVADAHHDAAERHQRDRAEAELVGAEDARRSRRRGRCAAGRRRARGCGRAGRSCTSACWVSARPISQGTPACLIEVSGDAPVPPSKPAICTDSAWPFETPAAIVPTPATGRRASREMSAFGLAFFRSWISCARSSIE